MLSSLLVLCRAFDPLSFPLSSRLAKQGAPPFRWRFLTCLLLPITFLAAAPPAALAGSYEVSYSGGTCSVTSSSSSNPPVPYTLDTSTGKFGGGSGAAAWGYQTNPDGTKTATSGKVECKGEITATLVWSTSTNEPPPQCVIVVEECNAHYTVGGNNDTHTGNASNGLQDAEVPSGSPPYSVGGTSSGTHYWVKNNPGASFDVTCSPSATIQGTGAVGPPSGGGGGGADVRYKVTSYLDGVMHSRKVCQAAL